MAGSVNKVILVGNLGADPEVRSFPSGGRIANLRIATSESWNDRNTGQRQERTEWHNVVIDNENLVKVAEQYLRKGSKVFVEGQLRTRKWQDRDGNDRYTTEVYVGRFRGDLTLLDRREGGMGGSAMGGGGPAGSIGDDRQPAGRGPGRTDPYDDGFGDDEVPF